MSPSPYSYINAAIIAIVAIIFLSGGCYVFIKLARRHLIARYISSSITFAIHRRFEALRKDIQVLFLGTCEFRSGIDARQLGPASFNFSVPRISFVELYYYLKRYFNDMPVLKLVVLSAHPNSFCADSATGTVAPHLFMKLMNARELLSVSSLATWPRLLGYKIFYGSDMAKIKGGSEILIKNLKRSIQKRQDAGERDALKSAAGNRQGGMIRAEDALSGVRKHYSLPMFDDRARLYFDKLLRLCRTRNIPVVTVCMPSSRHSQKHIKEQGFSGDEDIAGAIVKNPVYEKLIFRHLNYTDIFGERDDLFQFDGWELNGEGNRAFSQKIAADISGILNEISA